MGLGNESQRTVTCGLKGGELKGKTCNMLVMEINVASAARNWKHSWKGF